MAISGRNRHGISNDYICSRLLNGFKQLTKILSTQILGTSRTVCIPGHRGGQTLHKLTTHHMTMHVICAANNVEFKVHITHTYVCT